MQVQVIITIAEIQGVLDKNTYSCKNNLQNDKISAGHHPSLSSIEKFDNVFNLEVVKTPL